MAKRPNAANITHALAQFGGGSKKDGGGGMMGGLENVIRKAFEEGRNYELKCNDKTIELPNLTGKYIEQKKNKRGRK